MKKGNLPKAILFIVSLLLVVGCTSDQTGQDADAENAILEAEADATVEQVADPPSEEASSGKGELVVETVPAPSLANGLIGEKTEQTVAIYLPPSYSVGDRRFPSVYYLPAVNEEADSWGAGLMLESVMSGTLERGDVEEMILVTPSAGNVIGNTGIWTNSPVNGNWEDYVVEDLVTYVDANYRTLATSASRGIAGTLIGGYGAYTIAMHHPDVFGSVYTDGPTLFAPDGLEKSWIASLTTRPQMLTLMEEVATLAPEAAHERLLEVAADGVTPRSGTVGYAMAFVADVEPGSSYFDFEYIYLDEETQASTAVWERWASGYGDWDAKTAAFKENLASLKAIALSYDASDQLYIREGTQYASEQLVAAGIKHELNVTERMGTIEEMQDLVLLFFSQNLSFE